MSAGREIRAYDYVNQPYPLVCELLVARAGVVLGAASSAAATKANATAADLRVNIGGLDVGTRISFTLGSIEHHDGGAFAERRTRIPIAWKAARSPRLFPIMSGVLSVYPLSATETQLDFSGTYEPPLGPLGKAVDAAILHRIAEASVQGLVTDLARYLREKLPSSDSQPTPEEPRESSATAPGTEEAATLI